jgi:hypothetical protein
MSNIASRYKKLESDRQPFLTRARENAKLTIPSLIPDEGVSGSTKFDDPYQSVGARGVLGLSAKATQTLMPPNEPFFRLDIEEHTLADLSQNPEARAQAEQALTMVERTCSRAIEGAGIRAGFLEAVSHLIVGGNALIFLNSDLKMRVFSLDSYVVARDPAGNVIEIITKEVVARAALPEEVAALVANPDDGKIEQGAKTPPVKADTVDLYTHLKRDGKIYNVIQAVNDIEIPSSVGSYPIDKNPFIPLRWNRVDGEAYGRSHIEPLAGDLKTLEALSKAITEFTAGAAKVIPLVNPNGVTSEDDLAKAENFEFISGTAQDVTFLKIDKYADLQVAKQLADDLTRRLEQAFLMHSSVQRAGERVTAEEIRFMAADLEASIGAVYVQLSQEFQLPLVVIAIEQLVKQKRLPKLPKELVTPTVTTGIDALSRQSDLHKLDRMVAGLRDLYGPEALVAETNVSDYVKRRAAALGIDPTGLIKSPEQKKAEHEAKMQEQMMMNTAPNMVNQLGAAMTKGQE